MTIDQKDELRKVAMVLDYISTNSKDEGLCFILDRCVEDLTRVAHGVDDDD